MALSGCSFRLSSGRSAMHGQPTTQVCHSHHHTRDTRPLKRGNEMIEEVTPPSRELISPERLASLAANGR